MATIFDRSVLGSGAHPAAAQVFLNWCLTPAGQAVLSANEVSPVTGVAGAKFNANQVTYLDTDNVPQ